TEGTRENRCAGTTNASDSCFTGKEEDIDVGLTYFGKRYLSPYLNRWISPDPLAVHGLGADPNLYAYVSGQALKATDPLGLECDVDETCSFSPNATESAATKAGSSEANYSSAPARAVPVLAPARDPSSAPRRASIGQPGVVPWQQRMARDAVAAGYTVLGAIGSIVGYVVSRVAGDSDAEAVHTANVTAGTIGQVAVPAEVAAAGVAAAGAHRQALAAQNQSVAPQSPVTSSNAPSPGELEGIANQLHDSAARAAKMQPGRARAVGTVGMTQLDYPNMARTGPRIATYHGDPRIGVLVEKYAKAQGYVWGGSSQGPNSEHAEAIGKHFSGGEFANSPRGWSAASNLQCPECQGILLLDPLGPVLLPLNPWK
ncbi:MAG: RHS repeat-associated core domain-containing protein, partial [Myxococcales bacterium]|nr:RHS repeat-associated core domain-containing protein [Myxococcales bacterium]